MIPISDRLALRLVIGIGCALLLALLVHDRNRWKAKTEDYANCWRASALRMRPPSPMCAPPPSRRVPPTLQMPPG